MKRYLKKALRILPDSIYITLQYYYHFKRFPDLKNPKTFNEKLQWLKLHDRKPEYAQMVDKYEVKDLVAKKIGVDHVVPTLGVWDSFEQIDFDRLPDQFVLKCNHDSGSIVICKNKRELNIEAAKEKIVRGLQKSGYDYGREWPYKNVKPKIIAEHYLENNPMDYKYFCFNGIPKIVLVCSERFSDTGLKEDFFDIDWNHLTIKRRKHENSSQEIKKPEKHELMIELASKLAKNIPFVRIDFYEVDGKVYFGEITFYPVSGFEGFIPEKWDYQLGQWIKLPE